MIAIKSLNTYARFLLLIFIFIWSNTSWAQPDIKWDVELDVQVPFNIEGNEEARRAHHGDYVPIIIELKNCGPRFYDYPYLLVGVKIKLTVQGLELPTSDESFGPSPWWYVADEQIVGFGNVDNYCGPVLNTYLSGPTIMAKVIDNENAYITAEIVEYTYSGVYGGIDPNNLSSYEMDSWPNNGVDTDGDGDFSNDPDDEDDGDGLYLTDINTRKPIECSCTWETDEDAPLAKPEVIGESNDASEIVSNGNSGMAATTSAVGDNPLHSPTIPAPGSSASLSAEAGCMIAADVPSPFPSNPEEPLNHFRFDYFIESIARIGYRDDRGIMQNQELKMNYYVNSNDGSMFFDTETGGFFGANFLPARTRMGRVDGVVWKADGQRVIYGQDYATGTMRAVVVDQTQTAADVAGQKRLNVTTFMNSLGSAGRIPDPLPAHLATKWGDVPGYVGNMNDVDGTLSTATIYMGNSPDIAPIATNSPLVGFMVGVFKDPIRDNCNKLAVFTRMTTGVVDEFMEVELVNIRPREIIFDGRPYNITNIGATQGTAYKMNMEELEREALALSLQKDNLDIERRRDCAKNDIPCNDGYRSRMAILQAEIDDLQCQALCLAGMSSALPDCSCD
jgi:hypothetical protein